MEIKMNLETIVNTQLELDHALKSLTNQLEVIVNKIAGGKLADKKLEKPETRLDGILDELRYLQQENKETLQYLEDVLRRLAEATWMPMPEEVEYPVSNS